MWDLIEKQWDRGVICKPTVVPKEGREFVSRAINLLDQAILAANPQTLFTFDKSIIDYTVQAYMTAAREAFYYQRALYRDHAVYVSRNTQVRERPRGIYKPLSTGSYTLNDPSSALYMDDYRRSFEALR